MRRCHDDGVLANEVRGEAERVDDVAADVGQRPAFKRVAEQDLRVTRLSEDSVEGYGSRARAGR